MFKLLSPSQFKTFPLVVLTAMVLLATGVNNKLLLQTEFLINLSSSSSIVIRDAYKLFKSRFNETMFGIANDCFNFSFIVSDEQRSLYKFWIFSING